VSQYHSISAGSDYDIGRWGGMLLKMCVAMPPLLHIYWRNRTMLSVPH